MFAEPKKKDLQLIEKQWTTHLKVDTQVRSYFSSHVTKAPMQEKYMTLQADIKEY